MIEKTLVLIKPDGVKRGLVGDVIKRFERVGLKIIGLKMIWVDEDFANRHYPASEQQIIGMGNKTLQAARDTDTEEDIKRIFKTDDPKKIGEILRFWTINFLKSGPVVAMVVEGNRAINIVRKICGFTDPAKADLGTIRGDFGHTGIEVWNVKESAVKNLVHASGDEKDAKKEVRLWFKEKELHSYKTVHEEHVM